MAENFEAIISAHIKDFQRAMREVDREIRETAMGADADIGANISEFMTEMSTVDSMLSDLAQQHNIEIEADVAEALAEIEEVEAVLTSLPNEQEVEINADINDFISDMGAVEAALSALPAEHDINVEADVAQAVAEVAAVEVAVSALPNNVEIDIDADITDFVADTAVVRTTIWSLIRDRIVIPIETRVNNFQSTIARITNFTRNIQELQQTTMRGIGISLSPAIIPIIATLVGLLGNLGPMLGTVAGSTFALASAFGTAGIAAVGFGAAAMPSIQAVHGEVGKMTKAQRNAYKSLEKVKSVWKDIQGAVSDKAASAYGEALKAVSSVLTDLQPMFTSTADSFDRLMTSLNESVASPPIQKFFDYMNKEGGPMLERIGKAAGNFIKGFLSMMTAFAPLSESTAQGFLKMSEGFATWAAGLSESKRFQAFVSYVNENMPKIRAIFRDAIVGITELFAAFGPSSSDMMTSLQEMMAKFREWSAALGENQQFQKFISYLQTNGPKVAELIGNITTFLINMGIALAPMGSKLLDIVNGFLSWASAMLEAHPWIGKIIAAATVLTGLLTSSIPNIIAMASLLKGTGLKTWIFDIVKSFAIMVASAAKATAQFVVHIAKIIAQWVLLGARALLHAAKVAAAWVLATGKAMAKAVASMTVAAAKFVAKWALIGAQALIHAARVAAAWFIALGPVGWVIATVIALVVLIIANWDKVKAWTQKAWSAVSKFVKDSWTKVKSAVSNGAQNVWSLVSETFTKVVNFLRNLGTTFYKAGKGLIEQIIKGIKSMIGKVTSTISGVAKKIRNFLPFSPAKEGPLSDLDHLDFGGPIKDSINSAKRGVQNAMASLLSPPALAVEGERIDFSSEVDHLKRQIKQELSVDMSVNHEGRTAVENGVNGSEKQPLVLQMVMPDGRVFAEWIVDDITEMQNFEENRIRKFKRGQ